MPLKALKEKYPSSFWILCSRTTSIPLPICDAWTADGYKDETNFGVHSLYWMNYFITRGLLQVFDQTSMEENGQKTKKDKWVKYLQKDYWTSILDGNKLFQFLLVYVTIYCFASIYSEYWTLKFHSRRKYQWFLFARICIFVFPHSNSASVIQA